MRYHDSPIRGAYAVPWEPLPQIEPHRLPVGDPRYPGPWRTHDRGDGHEDVLDAEGRVFAHVYCWDASDYAVLNAAIEQSKQHRGGSR